MRKTLRSVICAVMVLVMMLTMAPSYAFAEGNTDAVETAETDTVQGEEQTELSDPAEISDNIEESKTDREESSDKTEVTETGSGESSVKTEVTETGSEVTDKEEASDQTESNIRESDNNQTADDSSKQEADKQKKVQQKTIRSADVSGDNAAPQADGKSDTSNAGSTNLNQFIIDAKFLDENGKEITKLNVGDSYAVQLGFTEKTGTDGQIDFNKTITYTLPEGLTLIKKDYDDISIKARIAGEQINVLFKVGYDDDGNITLTPQSGQDDKLKLLAQADNAAFDMRVNVRYDGEEGEREINFGNNVTKDVTVTSDSDLTTNKTAYYNKANGTVDYTLTITSYGSNTDVYLSDTISGDAVTLDPATIWVTSNKGTTEAVVTADGNKLTSNKFNMTGGEVVTVTYSALVDYTKLDGNIIDWDDTENTLHVESEKNKPEDNAHVR